MIPEFTDTILIEKKCPLCNGDDIYVTTSWDHGGIQWLYLYDCNSCKFEWMVNDETD